MLGIFDQLTDIAIELYPSKDADVVRLQAACEAAGIPAMHARQALTDYLAAHWQDVVSVPWAKEKQALKDRQDETAEAAAAAESAWAAALDAAKVKATAAWDDRIRQAFREDLPTIEAFIVMLERHEQLAVEAELAGVNHALSVSKNFLTSQEVAARLTYAKKALGLT